MRPTSLKIWFKHTSYKWNILLTKYLLRIAWVIFGFATQQTH